MAGTAGCGLVLNKQRVVRLHSLLPVWVPEVVISLTLMRSFLLSKYTAMNINDTSFVSLFVHSFIRLLIRLFVDCMAGTTGYGVVLNDQRIVRLHSLLAACMSAWSCDLAHSHALFCCPKTTLSMAMTTLRWCLLDDLLNVWNGYRVGLHCTNSASYVCVCRNCCVRACTWSSDYWCSTQYKVVALLSCAILLSNYLR